VGSSARGRDDARRLDVGRRRPRTEQVADGRAIAVLEAVLAIEQPGEATEEERIGMEVVA